MKSFESLALFIGTVILSFIGFGAGLIVGEGPVSYERSPNLDLSENAIWICPYVAKESKAYCMTLGDLILSGINDGDGGTDD
jgi:hypothetical protein